VRSASRAHAPAAAAIRLPSGSLPCFGTLCLYGRAWDLTSKPRKPPAVQVSRGSFVRIVTALSARSSEGVSRALLDARFARTCALAISSIDPWSMLAGARLSRFALETTPASTDIDTICAARLRSSRAASHNYLGSHNTRETFWSFGARVASSRVEPRRAASSRERNHARFSVLATRPLLFLRAARLPSSRSKKNCSTK